MRETEAIVLAGGFGGRMGEISKDKQKCILPVDGKPVLGHIMQALVLAFGSVDLKIGIGYKGDQVVEYVNNNKPEKVNVTYIPHIPGTEGWGIYRDMEDYVNGPFIATPGDVIALPEAYERVAQQFEEQDVDAAMTLSPDLQVIDTHGVGKVKEERVVELKWPPIASASKDYLRDMTIWASDPTFFDIIKQYPNPYKSIGYVFMDAVVDGRPIAGQEYSLPWVHLGYPSDLLKEAPKLDTFPGLLRDNRLQQSKIF